MNRWILLAAHVGIVLLAVSAALYLVIWIPLSSGRKTSTRTEILSPGSFSLPYASAPELISPFISIQIVAETNGTLNFKVFSLNYYVVTGWLIQQHLTRNLTLQTLNQFMAAYPGSVTEDFNVDSGPFFVEIAPSLPENATVVVTNPTSAIVRWHYVIQTVNIFAPRDRSLSALTVTVPIGVALIVPGLAAKLMERRKSNQLP